MYKALVAGDQIKNKYINPISKTVAKATNFFISVCKAVFNVASKVLNKQTAIINGWSKVNPSNHVIFQQTKTADFTTNPLKNIEKPVLASTCTRVSQ